MLRLNVADFRRFPIAPRASMQHRCNMAEHPISARIAEDGLKLRYFLQGVAASAIAFAMHETSDREPSLSLLIIAFAALAWACSFGAGVVNARRGELVLKRMLALELLDAGVGPIDQRPEVEQKMKRDNKRVSLAHQVQVWTLLSGAILYAGGHGLHLAERQSAKPAEITTPTPSSPHGVRQ